MACGVMPLASLIHWSSRCGNGHLQEHSCWHSDILHHKLLPHCGLPYFVGWRASSWKLVKVPPLPNLILPTVCWPVWAPGRRSEHTLVVTTMLSQILMVLCLSALAEIASRAAHLQHRDECLQCCSPVFQLYCCAFTYGQPEGSTNCWDVQRRHSGTLQVGTTV